MKSLRWKKPATMRKNTWGEKNACLRQKKLWGRKCMFAAEKSCSLMVLMSSNCCPPCAGPISGVLIIVLLRVYSSRAPLKESSWWLCCGWLQITFVDYVLPTMEIQCLYKQRGTVLYFHQATSEKITAIPGIHYFDAHRLDALLLTGPELQLYLRLATSQNRKSRRCCGSFLTKNYPRLMEKTRVMMLTQRTWNGARPTLMILSKKNWWAVESWTPSWPWCSPSQLLHTWELGALPA